MKFKKYFCSHNHFKKERVPAKRDFTNSTSKQNSPEAFRDSGIKLYAAAWCYPSAGNPVGIKMNFLIKIFIVIASIGLVECGHTIARQEAEIRAQLDRKLKQIGPVQDTNDVSFWHSRIALVKIGMPRALVHHILPQKRTSTSFGNPEKDGTEREFYWLDLHWAISLRFDDTGKSYRDSGYDKNLLVEPPKLIREDFRSFMKK